MGYISRLQSIRDSLEETATNIEDRDDVCPLGWTWNGYGATEKAFAPKYLQENWAEFENSPKNYS